MHNVNHKVDGDKLVIEIDISEASQIAAPLSSTGKTKLVASSGGTVWIPSPNGRAASFSLNVMGM